MIKNIDRKQEKNTEIDSDCLEAFDYVYAYINNELTDLKCNKRAILEPAVILVSCHAPHIAEELWNRLGKTESISGAEWPEFNAEYLVENSVRYPISFNGKTRFQLELPATMSKEDVEAEVLKNEQSQKWLEGNPPKKVIVVPGRIVNVVV